MQVLLIMTFFSRQWTVNRFKNKIQMNSLQIYNELIERLLYLKVKHNSISCTFFQDFILGKKKVGQMSLTFLFFKFYLVFYMTTTSKFNKSRTTMPYRLNKPVLALRYVSRNSASYVLSFGYLPRVIRSTPCCDHLTN